MSTIEASRAQNVWASIETEKRRDQIVRRTSVIAWGVTLIVLVLFSIMVGIDVSEKIRLMQIGAENTAAVLSALMPLVAVVGSVSLLVAVLSTVGVFLRLRTASLQEIQLRLAALEEVILAEFNGKEGDA